MAKVQIKKSTPRPFLLFSICFALALTCCFKKNQTEKNSNVRMFGGVPLTADNPGYRNTVFLAGPDKKPHCTASLVAPNLVLTAGHCVSNTLSFVIFRESDTSTPYALPVTGHREVLSTRRSETYSNFDVSWVRFEGTVPAPFEPLEILPTSAPLKEGAPVVYVGHESAIRDDFPRRTLDSKIVQFIDTPHVIGLIFSRAGEEQGVCYGDSGGPMYVRTQLEGETSERWFIAGVASGFDMDGRFSKSYRPSATKACKGATIIHSFAGHYKNWIEETAAVSLMGRKVAKRFDLSPGIPQVAHPSDFLSWCSTDFMPEAYWLLIDNLIKSARPRTYECAAAAQFYASPESAVSLNFPIPSLAPLQGLTGLTYLNLTGTNVSDISALFAMQKLKYLNLTGNAILDLSPLAGMISLEEFEFNSCAPKSLALLGKLPALKFLNLGSCLIPGFAEILPHAEGNLEILNAYKTQAPDRHLLQNFVRLKNLSVEKPCPFPDPNSKICDSGATYRNAAQYEVAPCAFQKLTSGPGNTPVALFENDDLRTPVITAPTETLVIAGRKTGSAVLIQIKSGPLQNRVFWTAEQNLALRSPACGR